MSVKIISGGPLSTIQDLGRFGVMKDGFTQSGAMDIHSMKIANRLVGNCLNCPVIEMTMMGVTAQFTQPYIICLSGGDFGAKINDKPITTNKAYQVKTNDTLTVGVAKNGLRCYLAVSGGLNVGYVMGSQCTNLKSSIGGYCGRKLQSGDVIQTSNYNFNIDDISTWHLPQSNYSTEVTVRAVLGPQDSMFTDDDIHTFFSEKYTVTNDFDRMGIRLDGKSLKGKNGMDIISDAIVFGSIQVPKSGKPIILMADHQTTGGYAKIATVISSDLPLLAQVKAGDTVTFTQVTTKQAEKIAKKEKRFFNKLYLF